MTTSTESSSADSGLVDSIRKAVAGDPKSAVIESGTLAVTRVTNGAAAVIAASYVAMQASGFDAWESIPAAEKIWLALAAAALWAVGSAADVIARGIATTKTDPAPSFVQLPAGLKGKKTDARDDPGWTAVAVRPADGSDPASPQWLILKGDSAEWIATDRIAFKD